MCSLQAIRNRDQPPALTMKEFAASLGSLTLRGKLAHA